jgi:hypothetical protein
LPRASKQAYFAVESYPPGWRIRFGAVNTGVIHTKATGLGEEIIKGKRLAIMSGINKREVIP